MSSKTVSICAAAKPASGTCTALTPFASFARQGGDDGHAVAAKRGEGFEIRRDARAAAWIKTRYPEEFLTMSPAAPHSWVMAREFQLPIVIEIQSIRTSSRGHQPRSKIYRN